MADAEKKQEGLGVFINDVPLPLGRLAPYFHLDEPENKGRYARNKHVAVILFPKDDKKLMAPLVEAFKKAASQAWPKVDIKDVDPPWRDGDEKSEKDGYAGHWFLKVDNKNKPRMVNRKREAVTQSAFYAGCQVQGLVTAIPWEKQDEVTVVIVGADGKERTEKRKKMARSVKFRLDALQFVRDGEPLSGGGGGADISKLPEIPDDGADDPANYGGKASEPSNDSLI